MKYYLITFSNTHSAIAAQNFLQGKLPFIIMPTLREISSSCGISLKIESTDYSTIKHVIELCFPTDNMYKIYEITGDKNKKVITPKP